MLGLGFLFKPSFAPPPVRLGNFSVGRQGLSPLPKRPRGQNLSHLQGQTQPPPERVPRALHFTLTPPSGGFPSALPVLGDLRPHLLCCPLGQGLNGVCPGKALCLMPQAGANPMTAQPWPAHTFPTYVTVRYPHKP